MKKIIYFVLLVVLTSCNEHYLKYKYTLEISGTITNSVNLTTLELNNLIYSNIDMLNYYKTKHNVVNTISENEDKKANKFIDDIFSEVFEPFLGDPNIRYRITIKGICKDKITGIYIPVDKYFTNF